MRTKLLYTLHNMYCQYFAEKMIKQKFVLKVSLKSSLQNFTMIRLKNPPKTQKLHQKLLDICSDPCISNQFEAV